MPRSVLRPQRPAGRLRAMTVLAGAAAVLACAGQHWGQPTWWALPVLAAVVAGSELSAVHLQLGRQRWTFSLTEGALAAAWVTATGVWSVLAVVAGVGVVRAVRRQPRLKVGFELAQFAAATALGSATAQVVGGGALGGGVLGGGVLGGGVPAAAVGMAVFFAVHHGLAGVAVSLTTRRRLTALLLGSAPLAALQTAGNASIGLLAAYLATTAPFGLLGLLVPLVLLWSSYDQQSRRSTEARLFAELARGQELATGRSSDVSAQVVVTATARLLGGADVEMVLLASDGPVRYVGDETGVPQRCRVEPQAFDVPWVVQALGAGSVSTGVQDGRPWVSAALGEPGSPLAVLLARRLPGSAGFGRREVRLVQVLVAQAQAWLSVSELTARSRAAEARASAVQEAAGSAARALGDLGAQTAPTLRVLHESAERLARLAGHGGDVDDIVDELHLVERAVASLLGAIALAAEPDLRTPAGVVDRRGAVRPVADWTTTGVLR